jgi:hypothetical protein
MGSGDQRYGQGIEHYGHRDHHADGSSSSSSFSSCSSISPCASTADQSEIVNIFILRPGSPLFVDPSLPHVPNHLSHVATPSIEDVICFAPPHGIENDDEAYADCPSTLFEILGNRIIYPNLRKSQNVQKSAVF